MVQASVFGCFWFHHRCPWSFGCWRRRSCSRDSYRSPTRASGRCLVGLGDSDLPSRKSVVAFLCVPSFSTPYVSNSADFYCTCLPACPYISIYIYPDPNAHTDVPSCILICTHVHIPRKKEECLSSIWFYLLWQTSLILQDKFS